MKDFIETAIEVASKSTMRKRYACLIIHKGRIISCGYNEKIISKFYVDDEERKSYHAERNAICKIKDKRILRECIFYIIRIDQMGNSWPAIPCEHCSKYLKRLGVIGIYTI